MEKDFDDFFANEEKKREEIFGLQSVLSQILWDAQVDDEDFNETFVSIINTIREVVKNEDLQKQLEKIDLNDYPIEE